MSANSSSNSSSRSLRTVAVPLCVHGLEADMLTSHTAQNPNRRFFCCSARKWDDCNFFRWVDYSYPNSSCNNNRVLTESSVFEELRLKNEELRLKNEECIALKSKLEEAELHALQLKLDEARQWKKWFLGLSIMILVAYVAKIVG